MARHGGSAGTLRVLHVDDDPAFARMTAEFLQRADDRFEVLTETDPRVALEQLTEDVDAVDCVLSDYQMPAMDGLELLRAVRTRFPDGALPFVLLTGRGSEEVAADALNAGATSYVQKGGPDTYEYVARRIREDVQHVRAAQNSAWFFTLVEALDDPVYVLDNEGRFTYVNEAMSELVGYGRAELVGSDPSIIKDEAAVDTAERNLGRILSADGPDSVRFEVTVESKSGDRIPCEDHMGVLPYEGERFQGSVGVLRDVTDRKERERALQEAKDRYQLLVEQNLLGLYIARGGIIVYHNERFGELFGSPAESNVLAGESLFSLVEAADRDRLAENVARVEADQGASLREPYIGRRRDGGTVNVELLARGIELDDDPAVIGTVVDVNDETERLWQLRHERDRLDQFTSIVSHDLRNPLNVAQGHLELARTEDGATDESLSTVADALVRMDELLNELLTLARQGEVVSDREAVDLRSVAESTWGNVATADATLSVTAEAHIDADPGRVKGVFENLYRNSVEHAGHDVTVRVGTLDDGFYVEDDGPGIPPADRDRVFESGYTTAGDGTGFGLAIVAEIVEAHGWRIAAVEGRDGGSRFEIRAGDRPVLCEP
ncbi:PAS domain S-box protein [Salinigranum sp.]|uniref:hybrid sensor histidine kinase/response regulator n=1 Tax=Salinigranum sp. TaxID=1966351 RepID=UPI003566AF8C